jgi:carbamate kinase
VSRVAIHYRTPQERDLDHVTVSEARRLLREGQFPAGSMGPKIEAAVRFLERGGKRAIIGHLNDALPALRGETGTHIVPDEH